MLGAAVGEKTSTDKKNLVSQDYRNFLFTFASSILHEIGHVFFTYLLKGVGDTPSKIRAHLIGKEHDTEGECGRSLEQLVFGGVVSYWRDPITGNSRGDVCPDIVAMVRG